MKDFLGQTLEQGDFLVYPGSGNGKAEYGLILYRVLSVKPDSIRAERLQVSYRPDVAVRKASTIKSGTKIVKIFPPPAMIKAFDAPEKNFEVVSEWVHGIKPIDWNTLQVNR